MDRLAAGSAVGAADGGSRLVSEVLVISHEERVILQKQ